MCENRYIKILKLIIKRKMTQGYDHFQEVSNISEAMRNAKYGIECSYQERLMADPHAFHVVFYTAVMEIIQQHKEKNT